MPFERETTRQELAAIMAAEPAPLPSGPDGTPPELQTIIRKCLQKDREERYQTATELLHDLEELQEGARPGARIPPSRRERTRLPLLWVAAAASVLAFGAAVVQRSREEPPRQLTAQPFTSFLGAEGSPAISPDGTRIAFSWNGVDASGTSDI